jgi:hypothetical protein
MLSNVKCLIPHSIGVLIHSLFMLNIFDCFNVLVVYPNTFNTFLIFNHILLSISKIINICLRDEDLFRKKNIKKNYIKMSKNI